MGGIDLDPASSDKAQNIVKANRYFTEESDGLSEEWTRRIWMNPPYAKELIGLFVGKLLKSPFSQAVILVNNATETKWGKSLLERSQAVCFFASRVKFLDLDGKASGADARRHRS